MMSTPYDYERQDAAAILATVATAGGGGVPSSSSSEEKTAGLGEFYRVSEYYGGEGYHAPYSHYESGPPGAGREGYGYAYHEQDVPPSQQQPPSAEGGLHYEEYPNTDREFAQYNPYSRTRPPPPHRPADGAAYPHPRYYEDSHVYPYYADRPYPRSSEADYHRPPPSSMDYPYRTADFRYEDPHAPPPAVPRDRRRPPPPHNYHAYPPHSQQHPPPPHHARFSRHHELQSPSYDSQEAYPRRMGPPSRSMRGYSDEYAHYTEGRHGDSPDFRHPPSLHRGPPLAHADTPQPYYSLPPHYAGKPYLHDDKELAVSSLSPGDTLSKHQSPLPPVRETQDEDKVLKPQFHKEDHKQSHLTENGNIAPLEDGIKEEKPKTTPDKENVKALVNNGNASTYSSLSPPTTTAPTTTSATSTTVTCTCKKSRCLKLYCQCFSTNALCNPLLCRCDGCYNTAEHVNARRHAMRTILQRNPGAFRSKFVPADGAAIPAEGKQETEDAAAATSEGLSPEKTKATTHKNGCKCRKSACLKKYCECFNADTKCGPNCRCLGCKNLPVGGGNNQGGRGNGVSNGKGAWMMDAAQNLAFLKHASPHPQRHPPYPPQHHYLRSITESPAKPIRHVPAYPPPPQPYYHYNMPPQQQPPLPPPQQQQSRTEQTPPRATGSFNNDDSPSGLAVNTLLMAAYAMTELDGRKDEEKSDDKQTPEVSPAPGGDCASTVALTTTTDPAEELQLTAWQEAQTSHLSLPTPTKDTEQPEVNDIGDTSQLNVAPTPTKNTVSLQSEVPLKASLSNEALSQQTAKDTNIDTLAPSIEERPSAEVSPDNADEKSRKRSHSAMEEEGEYECAPSSFSPPKRSDDTKIELFRKSSKSVGTIPLPERNVSADSDDVTAGCGKGVEDMNEPPAKRASVETAVQ